MSRFASAREEASNAAKLDAASGADAVRSMRTLIEQQQAELKFNQTQIEALNFEIARLKRWRLRGGGPFPRPD